MDVKLIVSYINPFVAILVGLAIMVLLRKKRKLIFWSIFALVEIYFIFTVYIFSLVYIFPSLVFLLFSYLVGNNTSLSLILTYIIVLLPLMAFVYLVNKTRYYKEFYSFVFCIIGLFVSLNSILTFTINLRGYEFPGEGPNIAQVCISAGYSVGCHQYTEYDAGDPIVLWCDGLYRVVGEKDSQGKYIYLKGLIKEDAEEIAFKALSWGYIIPTEFPSLIDTETGEKVTTLDYTNAGLLCINPIEGGYTISK